MKSRYNSFENFNNVVRSILNVFVLLYYCLQGHQRTSINYDTHTVTATSTVTHTRTEAVFDAWLPRVSELIVG